MNDNNLEEVFDNWRKRLDEAADTMERSTNGGKSEFHDELFWWRRPQDRPKPPNSTKKDNS